MSGGYCFNRQDPEHASTGVPRVDFFEDDTRGDMFFSVTALLSLVLLLGIEFANRFRLRKSEGQNGTYLLLPSYFWYLTLMMSTKLIFVFMYLLCNRLDDVIGRWGHVLPVSIHFATLHFFFEMPTFFFLRGGASRRDAWLAIMRSLVSFVISFVMLFTAAYFAIFSHLSDKPFAIFQTYQSLTLFAYGFIIVQPNYFVTRRPALLPYARCMFLYNFVWSVVSISMYFGSGEAYCAGYIIAFIFDGIYPPLVMYYAFMLDSQYWQGCLELKHGANPLAGYWEVDMEVISTISTTMHQPSSATKKLVPVIHFGMLDIDMTGYNSGGFSRVYKATFKRQRVALKLLFGMELNRESIVQFYKEAQVLKDLEHPNIVSCVGVTIMPPAVGLIMEFCPFGSLFDFLYTKQIAVAPAPASRFRASSLGSRGSESTTFSVPRIRTSSGGVASFSVGRRATSTPIYSGKGHEYQMMLDAARALEHVHSHGFLHCDMKSLNYLVTDSLQLKLSDFGEVRSIENPLMGGRAPRVAVVWCPPEVALPSATGEMYVSASDVFSLSMILSEILLKKLPMEDINNNFDYLSWHAALSSGVRPTLPDDTPKRLKTIIQQAWSYDPNDRPSASDITVALDDIIKKLDGPGTVKRSRSGSSSPPGSVGGVEMDAKDKDEGIAPWV